MPLHAASASHGRSSSSRSVRTLRKSRSVPSVNPLRRHVLETSNPHARAPRRRIERRSRSVIPPHTPYRSLLSRAHARHSARTGHAAHTARASCAYSSFVGKKIAGSMPLHTASASHGRSSSMILCIPSSRTPTAAASFLAPHQASFRFTTLNTPPTTGRSSAHNAVFCLRRSLVT